VTQSDDKPRGAGIREASKLRATLGSEPSSGYAFHDHLRVDRVERVRPARGDTAAPQTASHAPRERAFARTLVGGVTLQEALAGRELSPEPEVANDQQRSDAHTPWGSLPQVPQELHGSVEDEQDPLPSQRPLQTGSIRPEEAFGATPTSQTKKVSSKPPAVPQGAAIWEALPTVAETREKAPSAPPPAQQAAVETDPPRSSKPVLGYRASVAELNADFRGAYADDRLLQYEGLVERNAWEQLSDELAREANPSPALRLLRIVAQRETAKGDQKQAAARLTQEAIAAVAELLRVPEASPTALVLGKRLLRKNPGWLPKRQPNAGLSLSVLLGGIAAGAGVGWLVTTLLL
jgi:hypothetical protein